MSYFAGVSRDWKTALTSVIVVKLIKKKVVVMIGSRGTCQVLIWPAVEAAGVRFRRFDGFWLVSI